MIPRYAPSYSLWDGVRLACLPSIPPFSPNRLDFLGLDSAALVVPCPSAADGLAFVLKALDAKGKIGVPAFTCIRVPEAIKAAGCEPVFIDIDPASGVFGAEALAAFSPGDLQFIVATHLYGYPCDLDGIHLQARRINAVVIEDCALALGSRTGGRSVGSSSAIALYSFGRGKTINLSGGGLVLVHDVRLSHRIQSRISEREGADLAVGRLERIAGMLKLIALSRQPWKAYSGLMYWAKRAVTGTWFWEERTTASDSAYGRGCGKVNRFLALLATLDFSRHLDHARKIGQIYAEQITATPAVRHLRCLPDSEMVWPSYPLIVRDRQGLFRHLRANGIDCGVSFSYSCASVYAGLSMPGAEQLARQIITLPIHREVSIKQAKRIAHLVNGWTDSSTRDDSN